MEMGASGILLVWATALVFLIFRTNSFKTSVSTTIMVLCLFATAVLHRLYGDIGCLFLFAAAITVLVTRVVPHDTTDKWRKGVTNDQ